MFVISFQGAIYVRTALLPHRVEVYLPRSKTWGSRDGKGPPKHYSRVFVDEALLEDHDGFRKCPPADGTTGRQFKLDGNDVPFDGYRIEVRPTDPRPLTSYESVIKRHMPAVSQFADRISDGFDPAGGVAARVDLTGGEFRMKYTDRSAGLWTVDGVLGTQGSVGYPRLAYDLEWCIEPRPREEHLTIEIFNNHEVVASAKVRHRESSDQKIIIGNLDQTNSAKWPDRPNTRCTGPVCPDLDFKWIYELFDEELIRRELPPGGELPVPVLHRHRWDQESGYDTPTCFMGTD